MSREDFVPKRVPQAIIEKLYHQRTVWEFWKPEQEVAQLEVLSLISTSRLWVAIPCIAPLVVTASPAVRNESARIIADLLADDFPRIIAFLSNGLHSLVEYDAFVLDAIRSITRDAVWKLAIDEFGWAVFGVLSFHGSGWVREAALDRLEKCEDGNEIPFLLYRATDWVGIVADKAELLLTRRLETRPVRQLAVTLPVIYRLKSRLRGRLLSVQANIIARVAAEERIDFLTALANSSGLPVIRRWVLSLVVASNRPEAVALRKQLMEDRDPMVRLAVWEFSWKAEDFETAAGKGLSDPWPAIRRRSLEILASREDPQNLERFESALLDAASSVRATARFFLNRIGIVDTAPRYRAKLSTNGVAAIAAICGLSEVGAADDAKLLVPFLAHPRVGIRKAAVAGVSKLDPAGYSAEIRAALLDRSPSVSKTARLALEKNAGALGREYILELLEEKNSLHVRRAGLWLIRALPKWERLIRFLEALGPAPEFNDEIRRDIQRWLMQYNRSQQTPSSEEVKALQNLTTQYASFLQPHLTTELTHIASINFRSRCGF